MQPASSTYASRHLNIVFSQHTLMVQANQAKHVFQALDQILWKVTTKCSRKQQDIHVQEIALAQRAQLMLFG